MAIDVNIISRLVNGVQRNIDLASNSLVVGSLKVGTLLSHTELTKSILDKLILVQSQADADGSFDLQYLGITATAADSSKLNGQSASYYATASSVSGLSSVYLGLHATADDAAKLGGELPAYYATASSVSGLSSVYLGITATAADSSKLGGELPAYYATASSVSGLSSVYLGITATAADSSKLGGELPAYYATASALSSVSGVANAALPSASFTDAAVTGKLITGFVSGAGAVAATDTILAAINKLDGNINAAKIGAIIYKSTFDASAGNFDAITDPKQGWMYKVSVAGTISSVLLSVGDNLYINKDVTGHPAIADIDLIDNTEAADILRKGALTSGQIFVGSASNEATAVSMSGEASIIASGAVTLANSAVIGKVLTGYTAGAGVIAATDSILAGIQKADGNAAAAQSTANAALPSASFTDSAVTGKLITGFSSSAGTVAATDSILGAINKLDGNVVATVAVANAALPSASFTDSAVTGKLITGFSSGAGVISATDSILSAINKLDGNVAAAQSNSNSIKKVMVAGESFAANTTFVVRMAMDGETAGRVYKADWDASASDKFYAIGLVMVAAGASAGDSVTVTIVGEHTLGSADTAFGATKIGQACHLKAAGAFDAVSNITYAADQASFRVGVVQSTTKILVGNMQINGIA